MRAGEWLRALPTAGRLASKGIANHGALRLKLQGARGALACPTRATLGRMWLNFLSVYDALGDKLLALTTHTAIDPAVGTYYHRALGGSRTPGALIDRFTFTL